MQPRLLICYFQIHGVADAVNIIGQATYPASATVANLPTINPQFWLSADTDGNPILCTVKTTVMPLAGKFTDSISGTPYNLTAIPMPILDFVGGRPDDRR